MICSKCGVTMNPGTSYEYKNKKFISQRYHNFPECHYKKYSKCNFHGLIMKKI